MILALVHELYFQTFKSQKAAQIFHALKVRSKKVWEWGSRDQNYSGPSRRQTARLDQTKADPCNSRADLGLGQCIYSSVCPESLDGLR